MTAPYGQPEPFDPASIPVAPVRGKPGNRYLPIVAALALAVVTFGAGFGVANAIAPKTPAVTGVNGQGFNGQGFPGASGRPRGGAGGFGGGASGTVGSVSADQMTITTAAGAQRIVLLTPTTTVTQVTSATKAIADITSGTTVTIVGTSNPDGSVTATSVIIGDANIFGRGAFGPPDGSPAPTTNP
jgi:pectate lyase